MKMCDIEWCRILITEDMILHKIKTVQKYVITFYESVSRIGVSECSNNTYIFSYSTIFSFYWNFTHMTFCSVRTNGNAMVYCLIFINIEDKQKIYIP